MNVEKMKIAVCLKNTFESASDIYVDTDIKECEVKVSVDDFEGELFGKITGNGYQLEMVDFCDVYPFKYVFKYKTVRKLRKN